ncbi:MAG: flagellar motor protein MotA, partial [Pseudomonadota bacterium]
MSLDDADEAQMSNPQIYLLRMAVFLVIAGFLAFVVFRQIIDAFFANPFLNGLIIATLFIGVAYAVRQVMVLRPEVRWLNAFRVSDPGLDVG